MKSLSFFLTRHCATFLHLPIKHSKQLPSSSMRQILFCIFFICTMPAWTQKTAPKLLYGTISADSASVARIDVVNLNNEKVTRTNPNGEFYIVANEGDVLVFSAVHLEFRRKIISSTDIISGTLTIDMIPKINELEEVIVNPNTTKGISVFPGQKQYTPAERKLKTAKSGFLDAPINWVSGRTKKLKKQLVVEQKEQLLARVSYWYKDEFYTQKLKIPKEYISDFQHYIIEDKSFITALKAKNRTMMLFLISKLATDYNAISK